MDVQFSKEFRYFQAEALIQNITRYIENNQFQSLLDIGAGTPTMALALAGAVATYTAVEKDVGQAEKIALAGVQVICEEFPITLPRAFDLVLLSHSIPENGLDSYPQFLQAAWDQVNPGGMVLIVTFKGSLGAAEELYAEITGEPPPPSEALAMIMDILARFGTTVVERVNSYATSPFLSDIVSLVESWIYGKDADGPRRQALQRILQARYYLVDRFVFPTQHLFISCRKDVCPAAITE